MRDIEKARERGRRYRLRKKIERFGEEKAKVNLSGRHGNHSRGPAHYRYNHGLAISMEGYVKVQVGVAHPLVDSNGYAYLHHLVVAASGMHPSRDEVIHHKDGNTTNNRIDNLQILSRSEHSRIHSPGMQGRIPDELWVKEFPAAEPKAVVTG